MLSEPTRTVPGSVIAETRKAGAIACTALRVGSPTPARTPDSQSLTPESTAVTDHQNATAKRQQGQIGPCSGIQAAPSHPFSFLISSRSCCDNARAPVFIPGNENPGRRSCVLSYHPALRNRFGVPHASRPCVVVQP